MRGAGGWGGVGVHDVASPGRRWRRSGGRWPLCPTTAIAGRPTATARAVVAVTLRSRENRGLEHQSDDVPHLFPRFRPAAAVSAAIWDSHAGTDGSALPVTPCGSGSAPGSAARERRASGAAGLSNLAAGRLICCGQSGRIWTCVRPGEDLAAQKLLERHVLATHSRAGSPCATATTTPAPRARTAMLTADAIESPTTP